MTTQVSLFYGISDKVHYDEDTALGLLKSDADFFESWEFVKTVDTDYDTHNETLNLQICEFVFQETNIGSMLSSEEDQAKIKASKHHHTSMSVGDIVKIHGDKPELYLCADAGFERITDLVKLKEVVQK